MKKALHPGYFQPFAGHKHAELLPVTSALLQGGDLILFMELFKIETHFLSENPKGTEIGKTDFLSLMCIHSEQGCSTIQRKQTYFLL